MVPCEQVIAARREYRVKLGIRLGDLFLVCFFFLGCGLICLHWVLHPSLPDSVADAWYGLFLILFGLLVGIQAFEDLIASRVIL